MNTVQKLRNKFPTFSYDSFSWEKSGSDLNISFKYSLSPEFTFTSQLTIHRISEKSFSKLTTQEIDAYVANIGMSELLSYWKLTASPHISVQAFHFSSHQLGFWKQLLIQGMGEYFYQNQIDFSDPEFVSFSCNQIENPEYQFTSNPTHNHIQKVDSILIPVGGGKDSALTLELLKKSYKTGSLTISAPESAADLISVAKIEQKHQIQVTRTLDKKMIALNSEGFLNGHVPISASIAFISLLAARLNNFSHIAISNERSSNEGNVLYCDREINHQYSKTYYFETAFQNYVSQYFPEKTPYYFSFLRPLYELQIGMLFANYKKYHQVFRSCNKGQKTNSWCCNCSKCLFAWIILYPFLTQEELTSHFTQNLFENEQLWPVAQELLGLSETKPFECVGTHEESIAAFWLCIEKFKKQTSETGTTQLPVILQKVSNAFKNNQQLQTGPDNLSDYKQRATAILDSWNSEHTLPAELEDILKKALQKENKT